MARQIDYAAAVREIFPAGDAIRVLGVVESLRRGEDYPGFREAVRVATSHVTVNPYAVLAGEPVIRRIEVLESTNANVDLDVPIEAERFRRDRERAAAQDRSAARDRLLMEFLDEDVAESIDWAEVGRTMERNRVDTLDALLSIYGGSSKATESRLDRVRSGRLSADGWWVPGDASGDTNRSVSE